MMSSLPKSSSLSQPSLIDRYLSGLFTFEHREHSVDKIWGWLVVAVTIGANAALLVAQQVAFRLLAPLIGSSIETWSTIIGVFLLGIAIGNRVGGKLADHFSSPRLVVGSLAIGSLSLFSMPWLADWLMASSHFASWPLNFQILISATIVCLFPGVALSLVTQPSLRSLMTRADQVGSTSGNIFAWGTFGSLFGNYLAGFVLLALLGVRSIVWLTGWSLLGLALLTVVAGRRRLLATEPDTTDESVQPSATANQDAIANVPTGWRVRALVIVVACSFVSGALEGAAFRILAPVVGVSMFLTAGVIGAVLAGMSLGNALGGRIATQHGTPQALRDSLAACAVGTLFVAPIYSIVVSSHLFEGLGLIPQVVLWSFTLFFLPAMALGTITPQVIGLSVSDIRHVGTVSGRLYAWSTLGCIAGILVSAWFMIEAIGAIRTSTICGVVPLLLMWLISPQAITGQDQDEKPSAASGRTLTWALLVFSVVWLVVCKSPYDRESKYFALAVIDDVVDGRPVKKLVLDRLVHSAVDVEDPEFLFYPHERVQGEFTRAAAADARAAGRKPKILVIGGGGYSFPRWVEAQEDLADVQIDVVEIDPEVTEIAHDQLGLPRSTRINSFHMDGRQFVKSADAGSYDLVIQDAVNDYSVPYHLMTAQYNQLIQRILHPEGIYLLTVIDGLESGRFLASALKSVRVAFSDTSLLAPQETASLKVRSVFVIAGRNSEADNARAGGSASLNARTAAHIFDAREIHGLLNRQAGRSPLLTDDYAPVDILMTSQFLSRAD